MKSACSKDLVLLSGVTTFKNNSIHENLLNEDISAIDQLSNDPVLLLFYGFEVLSRRNGKTCETRSYHFSLILLLFVIACCDWLRLLAQKEWLTLKRCKVPRRQISTMSLGQSNLNLDYHWFFQILLQASLVSKLSVVWPAIERSKPSTKPIASGNFRTVWRNHYRNWRGPWPHCTLWVCDGFE